MAASEFLCNSHSSYTLLPHLYTVTQENWVGGWPILKVNLFIIGCDDHAVRYGVVGQCRQSVSSHDNEFVSSCLLYVLHSSIFYSIYSFQLNSIEVSIPKEDHSKTLIKFVLVLRNHGILKKSNTIAGEKQRSLQDEKITFNYCLRDGSMGRQAD